MRIKKLLGGGSAALPERSEQDEEGLRIGAALAIVKEGGDLEQFAGSRTDMLALMMTAIKRGLIAWDRTGMRYDLTPLGETHLEAYGTRPSSSSTPDPAVSAPAGAAPNTVRSRTARDTLAGAATSIVGAATSLNAFAGTLKGSVSGGAQRMMALKASITGGTRQVMSGKGVVAVAGAAAVLGIVVGASMGSSRLEDPAARSGAMPKAADASPSAPAEKAHPIGVAGTTEAAAPPSGAAAVPRGGPGSTGSAAPQPPAAGAPENAEPVQLSDDTGQRGQSLAGGQADATRPNQAPAKPVVAPAKKTAEVAMSAANNGRKPALPETTKPEVRHTVAAAKPTEAAPAAGPVAAAVAAAHRPAEETARQPDRHPAAKVADAPRHGGTEAAVGAAHPALDAVHPTVAAVHPAQPPAKAAVRDAPAKTAQAIAPHVAPPSAAVGRKPALEQIMEALDRHRARSGGEATSEGVPALALQEAQPLDRRPQPKLNRGASAPPPVPEHTASAEPSTTAAAAPGSAAEQIAPPVVAARPDEAPAGADTQRLFAPAQGAVPLVRYPRPTPDRTANAPKADPGTSRKADAEPAVITPPRRRAAERIAPKVAAVRPDAGALAAEAERLPTPAEAVAPTRNRQPRTDRAATDRTAAGPRIDPGSSQRADAAPGAGAFVDRPQEQPDARSADAAPRIRPSMPGAEPPPLSPAPAGLLHRRAPPRTDQDSPDRDPNVARPDRGPPDEQATLPRSPPQSDDDCDVTDATADPRPAPDVSSPGNYYGYGYHYSYRPYGWRRYPPYDQDAAADRYADGRLTENRHYPAYRPGGWSHR
jgi:hypothetical protein